MYLELRCAVLLRWVGNIGARGLALSHIFNSPKLSMKVAIGRDISFPIMILATSSGTYLLCYKFGIEYRI